MILKNNNSSKHKKQVEKNKFVHKNETTHDFILICHKFSTMVSRQKDSPWKKKKNPLYGLKTDGEKKLGKTQIKLIYFLYEFFKKGKPVYFSYNNLSKNIKTNPTNLSKIIKSLVDRNIIIKENFKGKNNGGQHQVILMPNNPSNPSNFQDFFERKLLDQTNESYLTKQMKMLCKYSKLKRNFNQSRLLTINTKEDFKSYCISIQERLGLKTQCVHANAYGENLVYNKERKPMRVQLKHKTENKKEELTNKFKQRKKVTSKEKMIEEVGRELYPLIDKPKEQRKLTLKAMNRINKLVEEKYGSDFTPNNLLKIKDLTSIPSLIDNKLLFRLFDMVKEDVKMDYINTIKIIEHYNRKGKSGVTKFVVTKVAKNSPTFRRLQIIVSYLISVSSVDKVKRAIDRFHKMPGCTNYAFKYKVSILEFLTNPKDDPYLKVFFKEDDDFMVYPTLRSPKSHYEKAQERWKEMYVGLFVDPEEGERQYTRFKYKLSAFLENMIHHIKGFNLDLGDYDLLTSEESGEESVLDMYLEYLQKYTWARVPKISNITNLHFWESFVDDKMRGEEEQHNFFRTKRAEEDIEY